MNNIDLAEEIEQSAPSSGCRYYLPNELNLPPSSDKDLSLLHLNARSLPCNFGNLINLLNSIDHTFSFIGITESWLQDNSPPLFEMKGYRMLRADRQTGRGGGAVLYIRDDVPFKVIDDIPILIDFQTIFVEIENPKGKNIVIGVTYRPPSTSIDVFIDYMESCFNIFCRGGKQIYLMGDFNIHLLQNDASTKRFTTFLSLYALYPIIDIPTRISPNSATLIDNIVTNAVNGNLQSGALYSDVSDHLPIFCIQSNTIHVDKQCNGDNMLFLRNYSDSRIESFNRDLAKESWAEVYRENTVVDRAYTFFKKKETHILFG